MEYWSAPNSLEHRGQTVGEVGVHRENGQVEEGGVGGEPGEVVPGKLEQLLVLVAPPHIVILGNLPRLPAVEQVPHLIIAVLGEILPAAPEVGVGADEQRLAVALAGQDIPQADDAGEEALLAAHGVLRDGDLQGQAGGLAEQGPRRPGGAGERAAAVDPAPGPGEADILLRQPGQLRDGVVGEGPAVGLVGEGGLHRLQPDID